MGCLHSKSAYCAVDDDDGQVEVMHEPSSAFGDFHAAELRIDKARQKAAALKEDAARRDMSAFLTRSGTGGSLRTSEEMASYALRHSSSPQQLRTSEGRWVRTASDLEQDRPAAPVL
mmetsp:Transcript_147952/g.368712  ORF Transcript_147952/g.368712 Transcript_147952/m.368712 type:complete len:117 (-) Transcript_147952:143-493(-)